MSAAPAEPPDKPILQAALDAYDAGLCVIRVNTDGTKAPLGLWKQWQTSRPSRDMVARWFADGHPGMGVICGDVSGGLEMLEFEGRAVDDGILDDFFTACDAAGLGEVVNRIVDGCSERSPSGGPHMFYRVEGGLAGEGNRKLARSAVLETLIETRSEGGFVVVAPSHGTTHPSGRPWEAINGSFATIPTISRAERDAIFDICRRFDQVTEEMASKPLPPAVEARIELAAINTGDSENWMQAVIDELATRPWSDILGPYGWTETMASRGITYWRRPGKDEGGYSATTNAKGTDRLIVFSSSTPFMEYTGRGKAPSYDRLDVIATYSHGGDRVAAARALAGRDTRTRHTYTATLRSVDGHQVNPETGEIVAEEATQTPLLPEEFWTARPMFEHIRTAARARLISPDALLGVILARVSLMTDHRFVLPPIIGRYGTLDFLLGLSGRSGSGKGSTLDTAAELLPDRTGANDYRITTAPVGSGEGMVHAYHEPTSETIDGKKKTVYRRRWEGILFRIDEGQALGALAQRSGQTTMTTLRSAWSGELLGGSYASADKKVTLPAASYRFVGVMAIQPALARDILGDHIGGTPQRFVWLSLSDPAVPDHTPDWPGPLNWSPPTWTSHDAKPVMNNRMATTLHVADIVVDTLRRERKDKLRTGGTDDDHAALRRLKVAALLAILDERLSVTADDWYLAGLVSDTSRDAIEDMQRAISEQEERLIQRDVSLAGKRARAAELARASVADETDRVARIIGRHVHKHHGETSEPCHRRCVSKSVRSDLRHVAGEATTRAIALGWVVEDDDDGFLPGESRPA